MTLEGINLKKLVIVTRCLTSGGAERVVSEIAKYAVENGISCSIIMTDDREIFYKTDESIKLYTIGEISDNKILNRYLKYKKVRNIVKEINPDIVLTLPEDIGIYVIPAMLGSKIPVVVSERNNPWVMPYTKISRTLRKLFYPCASGYIFQTKMASSFFSKKIQKKGIVLPNPLALANIPDAFSGVRNKEVVSTGRLDNQKNFKLLMDAFKIFHETHPDYTLTIFGEGGQREELENYAREMLPDGVWKMPGRDNKWLEKAKTAGMFVLSSDFEGMPNALIEAMATGIPSISTDCPSGGSADLIENEINGILVPVKDKEKMAEAMCKIADDANFAHNLSKAAQKIKEDLTIEKVGKQWISYLEEVNETIN